MSDARLLSTFLDLVRIDSPSCAEAGVAAYAGEVLRASGCEVEIDGAGGVVGSNTGNLLAKLKANASGRSVLLSAHMDCVQPCEGVEPMVDGGVIMAAGATVLGADDKAGVAAILEAIRRVVERGRPHAEIRVILTVAEELGLRGAKAIDPAVLSGDVCLVLDADGPVGGMVSESPTHYTFTATFEGTAAHAGVCPESGKSAVSMAAGAIESMRLGRLDDETTANIGTIHGGTATNVVPAMVVMTGECRSRNTQRVEEVLADMENAMRHSAEHHGGSVKVDWTREYRGLRLKPHDDIVRLVEAACEDIGVAARPFATGGGSDGNIFGETGIPTLVLSCGMNGVHGIGESVAVAELERLTALVEAVLARAVD